jgi:hypothetical protein
VGTDKQDIILTVVWRRDKDGTLRSKKNKLSCNYLNEKANRDFHEHKKFAKLGMKEVMKIPLNTSYFKKQRFYIRQGM